jgi:hypothetical protein
MSTEQWIKTLTLISLSCLWISFIINSVQISFLREQVKHLNSVVFDSSRCPGDEE